MDERRSKRISKFLSLILRHDPQRVGITLDEHGWADVQELLANCAAHGEDITEEELRVVVVTNDKQRFTFSDDGQRIRAHQGHSVEVHLDHPVATPPELLYHGTVEKYVENIRRDGLLKRQRHDVHLSATMELASVVGQRRGTPVILTIRAGDMHRSGHEFHLSPNNVWLIDRVPPAFIEFPVAAHK
jgi:putative RNA 2'-phosphotransferase